MKPKIIVLTGNMDRNGNKVYYYKFIGGKAEDLTDNFTFFGRKTTKNKVKCIRSLRSPIELKAIFNSPSFSFYLHPGLKSLQQKIDACNCGDGCNRKCSAEYRMKCRLIRRHLELMELSEKIREIIEVEPNNYIQITEREWNKLDKR